MNMTGLENHFRNQAKTDRNFNDFFMGPGSCFPAPRDSWFRVHVLSSAEFDRLDYSSSGFAVFCRHLRRNFDVTADFAPKFGPLESRLCGNA